MIPRWIRTTVLTMLGVVATAGIGIAAVSAPASAHTELTRSDPASGAVLTTPPTAVTLTFSEDIGPDFAAVAVRSVDGRDQPTSAVRVSGPSVSTDLTGSIPGGGYVLNYRVVSADGHPVSGQVPFSVSGASTSSSTAAGAPATTSTTSATAPEASDGGSDGDDTPWVSIVAFAVLGALVGTGIVVVQKRRKRDS